MSLIAAVDHYLTIHTLASSMIGCDVCSSPIRGGRVMCLSCGTKTTIDLCDKPDCCNKEVGLDVRDDLTSPHLPTHDLFKVRTAIHPIREFGQAHRAALLALKAARQMLSSARDAEQLSRDGQKTEHEAPPTVGGDDMVSPRSQDTIHMPTCSRCSDRIHPPCWYCIECKGMCFDKSIRMKLTGEQNVQTMMRPSYVLLAI